MVITMTYNFVKKVAKNVHLHATHEGLCLALKYKQNRNNSNESNTTPAQKLSFLRNISEGYCQS